MHFPLFLFKGISDFSSNAAFGFGCEEIYRTVMSRVVSCSNPEPQTKVGVTTGRVGSTCAGVGGSVGRWERKTRLIADN